MSNISFGVKQFQSGFPPQESVRRVPRDRRFSEAILSIECAVNAANGNAATVRRVEIGPIGPPELGKPESGIKLRMRPPNPQIVAKAPPKQRTTIHRVRSRFSFLESDATFSRLVTFESMLMHGRKH